MAAEQAWFDHLRPDELAVLAEVERWADSGGTQGGLKARFSQALETAYSKVPGGVRDAVATAISHALNTFHYGSDWLVKRDAVMNQLQARLGPLQGAADLYRHPVQALDEVAQHYFQSAKTGLTIEGGVAGVSGLIGLAADIPILYCTLFKMIQEVAMCYGFAVRPEAEKVHILKVLDVGHDLGGRNRAQGMQSLLTLDRLIRAGAPLDALDFVEPQVGTHTQALTRQLRLARQLALDLIQRKLMQSLILVGGIIGAASNYQLATDVGTTAFHAYRRRFLIEVGLRRSVGLL